MNQYVQSVAFFTFWNTTIQIKPGTMKLQDLSKGRNRKSAIYLPVVDVETYEYEQGEVNFRISNITKRESLITIMISSKPIFKVSTLLGFCYSHFLRHF